MDRDMEMKLNELEEKINRNREDTTELKIVVMGPGPNHDNGLRGDIKSLAAQLKTAIEWGHDVWDVRRRKECLGTEALDDYKKEIAPLLATIDPNKPATDVANINLKGVYIMAILNFLGTLALALATILKASGGK